MQWTPWIFRNGGIVAFLAEICGSGIIYFYSPPHFFLLLLVLLLFRFLIIVLIICKSITCLYIYIYIYIIIMVLHDFEILYGNLTFYQTLTQSWQCYLYHSLPYCFSTWATLCSLRATVLGGGEGIPRHLKKEEDFCFPSISRIIYPTRACTDRSVCKTRKAYLDRAPQAPLTGYRSRAYYVCVYLFVCTRILEWKHIKPRISPVFVTSWSDWVWFTLPSEETYNSSSISSPCLMSSVSAARVSKQSKSIFHVRVLIKIPSYGIPCTV